MDLNSLIEKLVSEDQSVFLPLLDTEIAKQTWEQLQNTPVHRIAWSVRTQNVIDREGFKTLADLVGLSPNEWLNFKNFGWMSLVELQEQMAKIINDPNQFDLTEKAEVQHTLTYHLPLLNTEVSKEVWKILQHTPIHRFTWSVRTENPIRRQGLKTLAHLAKIPPDEWLKLKNFGRTSLAEIEDLVNEVIANPDRFDLGDGNSVETQTLQIQSLKELSHEILHSLREREQEVIKHYYGYEGVPKNLQQTGEAIGISRERVRQIKQEINEKINQGTEHHLITTTITNLLSGAIADYLANSNESSELEELQQIVCQQLKVTTEDQWIINWFDSAFANRWLTFGLDDYEIVPFQWPFQREETIDLCKNSAESFIAQLRERDPSVRHKAVEALGKIGKPAVPSLIETFTDRDILTRRCATEALGKIGEPAVSDLVEALKDEDDQVRYWAVEALDQIGEAATPATSVLRNLSSDENPFVRRRAIKVLNQLGEPTVLKLRQPMASEDKEIHQPEASLEDSPEITTPLEQTIVESNTDYDRWNRAIVNYVISGLPTGETIYLSVNETVLTDIANHLDQSSEVNQTDSVQAFLKAVRSACVVGERITLDPIYGVDAHHFPRCVGFLGAMVLAAHRMTEDEETAEINYFTRFRQVLGLPDEQGGRPAGLLPAGVEEKLWLNWNRWLIQRGWVPSAERGQSEVYKYTNYPLSQALLRQGDSERVERIFRDEDKASRIHRNWDSDRFAAWLRENASLFTSKHLSKLATETEPRRHQAFVDALYDVYTAIDWDTEITTELRQARLMSRHLTAGLYRVEDPIMGTIDYYLHPRQPRRWQGGNLEIVRESESYGLEENQPGWFSPLWEWTEALAGGVCYEVRGDSQVRELVLPERKFWFLVRDPHDEESGVFATWKPPELGETFLLVCYEEFADQLEILRSEKLIDWADRLPLSDKYDGWVEYYECMVLSPEWEGIMAIDEDLLSALKPSLSATIHLKGGLRVPRASGWLEGYAPEVTITAFDDSVKFKIASLSHPDDSVMDEFVNTNEPINLPSLASGDYLLEITDGRKSLSRRTLQILPWESLDSFTPLNSFEVKIGDAVLQGAVLKERKED